MGSAHHLTHMNIWPLKSNENLSYGADKNGAVEI